MELDRRKVEDWVKKRFSTICAGIIWVEAKLIDVVIIRENSKKTEAILRLKLAYDEYKTELEKKEKGDFVERIIDDRCILWSYEKGFQKLLSEEDILKVGSD